VVCEASLLTSMDIYVSRDGQEFGPYTLEDVNAYIASGQINATDLAWFDGETDWKPLHELLCSPNSSSNPQVSLRPRRTRRATKITDAQILKIIRLAGEPVGDWFLAEKVSVPAIGEIRGCAFLLDWRVSPPCRGSPHHLRHRGRRRQGARPELQILGRRQRRDRHRPHRSLIQFVVGRLRCRTARVVCPLRRLRVSRATVQGPEFVIWVVGRAAVRNLSSIE